MMKLKILAKFEIIENNQPKRKHGIPNCYLVAFYMKNIHISFDFFEEKSLITYMKRNKDMGFMNFKATTNTTLILLEDIPIIKVNLKYNDYYKNIINYNELVHYRNYFTAYEDIEGYTNKTLYNNKAQAKKICVQSLNHYFRYVGILNSTFKDLFEKEGLGLNKEMLYRLIDTNYKPYIYLLTHKYYNTNKEIEKIMLLRRVDLEFKYSKDVIDRICINLDILMTVENVWDKYDTIPFI